MPAFSISALTLSFGSSFRSDECHTMQHWHVYIKWNERGFEEASKAYKDGRIATDPAKTWYRDELNKFDNFVIPLTMQMKDIDAFVVSSDEYLVSF